jgi:hypothetical protein
LETSWATFLKSSVVADFQLYRVANSFSVCEEGLIADDVAQHVQHGRALAAGQRPQLRRIVLHARGLNDRNIIHREGFHGIVAECDSSAPARRYARSTEFRIGRQAVGEPEMIARGGRYQHFPPLAGDLVGQQFGPTCLPMACGFRKIKPRRGIAVGRAAFRLDHGEIGVGRQTEIAREEGHHLADLLAILLRHALLGSPRKYSVVVTPSAETLAPGSRTTAMLPGKDGCSK